MKKSISFQFVFFALWIGLVGQSGNVALAQSSTLSADGVYVPKLTAAQRNAIASPVNGQMVYNTDDECFNVYQKNTWQKLCGLDISITDTWTRKADFGGAPCTSATAFSIGNKGYVGLGDTNAGNINKEFWEYNSFTDSWTQKSDFPGGVNTTVGFSIGTKGYIGFGQGGNSLLLWEYDSATNQWTQKADFIGQSRVFTAAFSIGNKGYIGTGIGPGGIVKKDFWEYDPTSLVNGTDTNGNPKGKWTQKADFGGGERWCAVGFSIGNKGYIGTGTNSNNDSLKDFWEYNPDTNQWTQKADFGGSERYSAVGFSINNKGYIGTGNISGREYTTDLWEYDPTSHTNGTDLNGNPKGKWIKKADFTRGATARAAGFSIGNKGYISTGLGAKSKELWEYNPNGSEITQQGNNFNGNLQLVKTDSTGKMPDIVLPSSATIQGNTFNGNAQLVKTDGSGKIPTGVLPENLTAQGNIFNGITQLVKTDGSGKIPTDVLPENLTAQGNTFNGITQLVQTDDSGIIPVSVLPVSATIQGNIFNGTTQLVQTNATGKIPATVLPVTATVQGNTFNGNTQLVQTDATGKILTGILPATVTSQGNNFNAANQLTKLDASGFLGIGIASPKAPIHLTNLLSNRKIILWQGENLDNSHQFYGFGVNTNIFRYQVDHINSSHVFYAATSTTTSNELFRINGTGGACLNGNMVTTGASCTSDIRYKRNFSSIANPLDKILQMNGFQYYWKTEQFKEKNFPASRQIGFIAQEVEALFPELVNTDEKGYKSVDYARLTPVLVEAIKELKKENDRISNENISIRKESVSIRKDVEALKTLILQTQNGK